ncbi:unnamed protein product, partial [Polarella glacialis]
MAQVSVEAICAVHLRLPLIAVGTSGDLRSQDGTLLLLSSASFRRLQTWPEPCSALAWHPEGPTLAVLIVSGQSSTVQLFTNIAVGDRPAEDIRLRCAHSLQLAPVPNFSSAAGCGRLFLGSGHLLLGGKELCVWGCSFARWRPEAQGAHFLHCAAEPELQQGLGNLGDILSLGLDSSERFLASIHDDGSELPGGDLWVWWAAEGAEALGQADSELISLRRRPTTDSRKRSPGGRAGSRGFMAGCCCEPLSSTGLPTRAARWAPVPEEGHDEFSEAGGPPPAPSRPAMLASLDVDGVVTVWREAALSEPPGFVAEARWSPDDLWPLTGGESQPSFPNNNRNNSNSNNSNSSNSNNNSNSRNNNNNSRNNNSNNNSNNSNNNNNNHRVHRASNNQNLSGNFNDPVNSNRGNCFCPAHFTWVVPAPGASPACRTSYAPSDWGDDRPGLPLRDHRHGRWAPEWPSPKTPALGELVICRADGQVACFRFEAEGLSLESPLFARQALPARPVAVLAPCCMVTSGCGTGAVLHARAVRGEDQSCGALEIWLASNCGDFQCLRVEPAFVASQASNATTESTAGGLLPACAVDGGLHVGDDREVVEEVAVHYHLGFAAVHIRRPGHNASAVWVSELPEASAEFVAGHFRCPDGYTMLQDQGLGTLRAEDGLSAICWAPGRQVPPVLLGVCGSSGALVAVTVDPVRGIGSSLWTSVVARSPTSPEESEAGVEVVNSPVIGVQQLDCVCEDDHERAMLCLVASSPWVSEGSDVVCALARLEVSSSGAALPCLQLLYLHRTPLPSPFACCAIEWLGSGLTGTSNSERGELLGQLAVWVENSAEIQVFTLELKDTVSCQVGPRALGTASAPLSSGLGQGRSFSGPSPRVLRLALCDEWLVAMTSLGQVLLWSLASAVEGPEDSHAVAQLCYRFPLATRALANLQSSVPAAASRGKSLQPWYRDGPVSQSGGSSSFTEVQGLEGQSAAELTEGRLTLRRLSSGGLGILASGRSHSAEAPALALLRARGSGEGEAWRVAELRSEALPLDARAQIWSADGLCVIHAGHCGGSGEGGPRRPAVFTAELPENARGWLCGSTPCPAYHPDTLTWLLRRGETATAQRVLRQLLEVLQRSPRTLGIQPLLELPFDVFQTSEAAIPEDLASDNSRADKSRGTASGRQATSSSFLGMGMGSSSNKGSAAPSSGAGDTAASLFGGDEDVEARLARLRRSWMSALDDEEEEKTEEPRKEWEDEAEEEVPSLAAEALVSSDGGWQFSQSDLDQLAMYLQITSLPLVSAHEQAQLLVLLQDVGAAPHASDLDEGGRRYMKAFELHAAVHRWHLNWGAASGPEPFLRHLSSEDMCWALHSDCQGTIVDKLLEGMGADLDWPALRRAGLGLWITDMPALKRVMEALPRCILRRQGQEKKPESVALWYALLGRRTLLAALYRSQGLEKVADFLCNDLSCEPWQAKAEKNAFELIRQRRFEMACAFFVLANRARDAVDVAIRYMNDWPLGLLIAQHASKSGTDMTADLRRVMLEDMLPLALRAGDPWLASLAYWHVGENALAVRSVMPPYRGANGAASVQDEPGIGGDAPSHLFSGGALRHGGVSPGLPRFLAVLKVVLAKRNEAAPPEADEAPNGGGSLAMVCRAYLARRQPLLAVPSSQQAAALPWRTAVGIGRALAALFCSGAQPMIQPDGVSVLSPLAEVLHARLGLPRAVARSLLLEVNSQALLEATEAMDPWSACTDASAFYSRARSASPLPPPPALPRSEGPVAGEAGPSALWLLPCISSDASRGFRASSSPVTIEEELEAPPVEEVQAPPVQAILVDEDERPGRKGKGKKGKGESEKGKGEPEKGKEALEEEQEKKDEKDERDRDEKAVEEESEKGKGVALMDGRGGHAQKRNRKSSGQDCEHPHQAPATAVQDLAEAAVHSGVKQKDLEALSRLGAHGKSPQNCQRDLISSCFVDLFSPAVSVFKAPYKFLDKDTGDQTTKWHDTHVLYPHDWFVALDKASLTDRLLGTTDDIDSFWKWQKIDNPKFFRNAFYEGLENFEKLVPILVHGDGAQHAEHDSLVAVSFRSLLTTCSVEDSQFLCAGSCKSCKDEGTWPVHWKHLAWSFTALARGIHPCEDADGNSWPIGSYRASVAGTPLCPNSGFRAVIWVLAGDMDYLQVDLGLPHQASLDPCAWCKCNKSDTPFNDFRENAKWKTVRRSPADHIADPVTNHLIMTIPGVNFFCFHLDSLHVLDLGVTSHAIGNLLWEICVDHLPGNRAVALATLNKQIAEIYIELNVPKSKWIPALTYKHFNATASTYPNLKHMKGRRIRQFVPVALKLAQEFCADDEHTQHRLEVFKSLDTLYNCIDSPGLEFSSEVSWTYGSESFMGTVAALCQFMAPAVEDKLWIDSTEHEGSLVWMQWGKSHSDTPVQWWYADYDGVQKDGVHTMKWTHDIGSQLWKARDVKRNTIYDKSYKEPVENVTKEPEGEVTMEPEEEVTMPVKNKLTIRRVKKNLRKLKRTLRMLKKNKQEALLSKQFHSLNAKWKTVRRSPADHIADPVTNHLIMTIPGVNFFCFHLDSLHVLDLGVTSHAIGNLLWEICVDHLPGNRAVALATLNKQIAEIYIELNVPKSKWIPALTYKHFNATASTYPNLKHMKGRRIRQFVPVALKLAQEFCADDEHTQHRRETEASEARACPPLGSPPLKEVNVPVAGPAPGCSVDSEEVGLLQGSQLFKAQGSVPLTADRGGSEVRKPGCQRGGKGATTTTNTTTTTKLALTIATQPDVVGYYVWTWSSSTTVPTGATIGVCFSGYAEVATALSQCSSVEANLVGTKYLSIGGGGKNDYGLITADRLTAVGAAAATILSAGYEGVIFDIEEVSGSTDEINDALDAAVASLKASGLAAAVTTSHSCPYKCTGCDSSALVASWLKNADIGLLSPQLYTLGTESKIDTTPTSGCPWSLYANATAVVAPSIVQASQYDSAEAFFATEGVGIGVAAAVPLVPEAIIATFLVGQFLAAQLTRAPAQVKVGIGVAAAVPLVPEAITATLLVGQFLAAQLTRAPAQVKVEHGAAEAERAAGVAGARCAKLQALVKLTDADGRTYFWDRRSKAQAPPAAEVKTEESPTVVKDLSAKLVEVTADSAQLREELAVLKREMAEFAAARHFVEKRGKRLERSRSTSRSRRSRKNKSKKSKPSYDSSPSASRSPCESRSRGSRRTPVPAARSSRGRSRGRPTSSRKSSVAPPSRSPDRRSRSSRNRVSRRSSPVHSRGRGSKRSISRHKSVAAASRSPDRSVSRRSCSRRVSRHGSAARSRSGGNLSKPSISSRKSSPAGASRSPARSASKQSRCSRRSSAVRSRSSSGDKQVVPSRQASPASSSPSPSPRVSWSSCPSRSLAAVPQKQQQSVPDRFMTSVVHGKPPGSWAPGASPQVDGVGTRLAVTEWCPSGEKPVSATYVFFHATGFHSRCWDEVIKRLDADAHCFAIDARGHGQSDKPPPRDGVYLWPELADEAASVLRTLGVKDALGIGHSMGGYLLLHAALSDKSFFSGLLLLDPVVAPAAHYAAWTVESAANQPTSFVGKRFDKFTSPSNMYSRLHGKGSYKSWGDDCLADYCAHGLMQAASRSTGWGPAGMEESQRAEEKSHLMLACPPQIEAATYAGSTSHSDRDRYKELQIPVVILRAEFGLETISLGSKDIFNASPTDPDL